MIPAGRLFCHFFSFSAYSILEATIGGLGTLMDRDDEQLVAEVQAGDTAQFGVLYDRYIGAMYRFLYVRTGHKETAEELTSDVFFRALDRIHGFRPRRGGFRAWLYAIARHRVIDHYRRKRPVLSLDDAMEIPGTEASSEAALDIKLRLERARELMRKLSPAEQEVLLLHAWEGLAHKEIAKVIGKSESAVKKMFSRAVQKLHLFMYEERQS